MLNALTGCEVISAMAAVVVRESLMGMISDMHKDAYGFRPSGDMYGRLREMSDAELDAMVNNLQRDINESIDREKIAEDRAYAKWDARMTANMAQFNIDRETAIRWDRQAEDDFGDLGYYCWNQGFDVSRLTGQNRG